MDKVLNFYIAANKLKTVVRTGWEEVGISSDRLESVAEHIYGDIVLALALDSEYNLELDMLKVFKMLVIKEFKKIALKELSVRDLTNEERLKEEENVVVKLTEGLIKQEEMLGILDEYKKCETKEAKFAFQLGEIESDIQAKIYDLEGNFDKDKALEDAKNYGEELANEIIPQVKNASDAWILYNRRYYTDEVFKELSQSIQNLKDL